jgi:hypothetical protein
METIGSLNLVRFLDFYFAFMFVASTWRRLSQYHTAAQIALKLPKRWPNLMQLISSHRMIFWSWSTILPAILALGLWLVQILASRLVWPEAANGEHAMTISRVLELWPTLAYIGPAFLLMLAFDLYTLYVVGKIDMPMLEKHFDQAEYWLKSRAADVVRVASLGFVNPRKMVETEVETALVGVSEMLNSRLWWWAVQVAFRVSFGLSVWLTWAFTH